MGLLTTTHKDYYQSNELGNYQFVSLEDIINQFMVTHVGDQKIINKASRIDVAFHAQRALAELSFDVFKSIKSYQIDIPNTLVMPLPRDYVNYTKLTWVDSAGIKHPLYPTNRTSNPFQIRQDDDGAYAFPEDLEYIVNGDFASSFDAPWFRAGDSMNFGSLYQPGLGIENEILQFSFVTKNGSGATNWGHAMAVYQEIDTSDLLYLDISAEGTADTIAEGVGTLRFGLSTAPPDSNIKNPVGSTSHPITENTNNNRFNLFDSNGNPSYVEWVGPASVGTTSSTQTKLSIDVRSVNKVYAIVISFVDWNTGLGHGNSEDMNYIDNLSVTNTYASTSLQPKFGNETESSTWKSYKGTTPSENNTDDYQDDTYWPANGERYGLDPQHAQVNGSFFIDPRLGKIHFSSNISGKTVILDYISDSLGTDGEMQVHKFAEDAMYKWITHAVLSTSSYGQALVPRLTKDKFAAVRKAKLRLSNLKIEELTQVLRGKSKQIKH
jgi:hypothetical protein